MDWPDVIETVNRSSIIMFDDCLVCTLCNAKLPEMSQFNSHTEGKTHRENVRDQLQQTVDNVFSIGIFFKDEKLYCNLCNCNLEWLQRKSHVRSYDHSLKLLQQIESGHSWFKNENKVVETINKACTLVINENKYCILCKYYPLLPAWAQYDSHTNAAHHMSNVEKQLQEAVNKTFSLGVILDYGKFYCTLCNENILFSEQLNHCKCYFHKNEVLKQFDANVYWPYSDYENSENESSDFSY